jgi:hypothetical protein
MKVREGTKQHAQSSCQSKAGTDGGHLRADDTNREVQRPSWGKPTRGSTCSRSIGAAESIFGLDKLKVPNRESTRECAFVKHA